MDGLEAHAHHRVRTQRLGVFNETIDRLLTGFGKHLGVLVDFAPGQIAKDRHDVLPHMACADRVSSHQPQRTHDAFALDIGRGHEDHR